MQQIRFMKKFLPKLCSKDNISELQRGKVVKLHNQHLVFPSNIAGFGKLDREISNNLAN